MDPMYEKLVANCFFLYLVVHSSSFDETLVHWKRHEGFLWPSTMKQNILDLYMYIDMCERISHYSQVLPLCRKQNL